MGIGLIAGAVFVGLGLAILVAQIKRLRDPDWEEHGWPAQHPVSASILLGMFLVPWRDPGRPVRGRVARTYEILVGSLLGVVALGIGGLVLWSAFTS